MKKIINIIQANGVNARERSILCLPINKLIMKVFSTPLSLYDHLSVETDGMRVSVTLAGCNSVIQEDLEADIAGRLSGYLQEGRLRQASLLTKRRYQN